MVLGACLVVIFVPQGKQSLTVAQMEELLRSSALPWAGVIGTAAITLVALPVALRPALLAERWQGAAGGVAFGLLAGFTGGTSMTAARLCTLLFNHYSWEAMAIPLAWPGAILSFAGEVAMVVALGFHGGVGENGKAIKTEHHVDE